MSNQSTDQKMEDHPMDGPVTLDKGKGKAADVSMEEDDDSSEEESGAEDHGEVEADDEDSMEEINTDNIIQDGRRTRGKNIDFKKAAAELDDDDEEDDDGDFQDPDDTMQE
ncbi:hypothetical protein AOQ84DRAFT_372038 [Glonium stellatum]|uniref:Histone chaperone domain-containing protein n=1 Tax=Glonium stellatum TaxID=574774 RepID=A0A8E2JY86_9PEZI|nr:hypothetical protein AOQ84DRAFT_372038 [Glonium stellatum]